MKKNGLVYAIGAYVLWGFFPVYWKRLYAVNPLQIIAHRIIWSFLATLAVLVFTRQVKRFLRHFFNLRTIWVYAAASLVITLNWLTYVLGVQANRVVEASLGYFIFPLLSVLIGVLFLRERLRLMQWIAVGVAAIGVLYLSTVYGRLPWIAFILAVTFSLYGLLKKMAPLSALHGLLVEAGCMFIPSSVYLAIIHANGMGAFASMSIKTDMLLVGAGIITAIPLFMFSVAAQRLPLSILGIAQYLAPTLAFLLGIFIYHEPFDASRLAGFAAVWLALGLFVYDGQAKKKTSPQH